MRILKSTILAIGMMGLVACGGSSDSGETTPAANPCAENPCEGGEENPCAENPCEGGEENPCGENPCGMGEENPCEGGEENPCG